MFHYTGPLRFDCMHRQMPELTYMTLEMCQSVQSNALSWVLGPALCIKIMLIETVDKRAYLRNAVSLKIEHTRHAKLNTIEHGHDFQYSVVERRANEILPPHQPPYCALQFALH